MPFGSRSGALLAAQVLRLEDTDLIQRTLGWCYQKSEEILGCQKTEAYTMATHANILKTLHRPSKTGFLVEGGLTTTNPNLFSSYFLGHLSQDWSFVYHLYTKNATFSLTLQNSIAYSTSSLKCLKLISMLIFLQSPCFKGREEEEI